MKTKKIFLVLLLKTIKTKFYKILMSNKFHFSPWFKNIRYQKVAKVYFTFLQIGTRYSLILKIQILNKIMMTWFSNKALIKEIMKYKIWYFKSKFNKENSNHHQFRMNKHIKTALAKRKRKKKRIYRKVTNENKKMII
jgi:hypothetical protein